MTNIWMYAHGGSGNHGCEAIVRSTYDVLKDLLWDKMFLISSKPEEDEEYGLRELCEIEKDMLPYPKISLPFICAYMALKLKNDYIPLDKLNYKKTIDLVKENDIALSIGGDNYCYADVNKYIMQHEMMISRGAKTVLWGCSVEPDVLNNTQIVEDLKRYQLITVRETITYNALKKVNLNTVLVADPAFLLRPTYVKLSSEFQTKNMVGINISPMIQKKEKVPDITIHNYELLIETILKRTDMGVALIPHVIWDDSDDRIPLIQLYERYKESGRILLIENQACSSLKYVISQCRFFVGARTHATIAAYSSCGPTLVVGYSVKARGIARDLFGDEEKYVLPVQTITRNDNLLEKFRWIFQNEEVIKKQLICQIPKFIKKSLVAKDYVERLL